ncbi:hypothetical protein V493_04676 [Pseudogymnoascus sp. VKM F-4281 (FW-2241)]|nr:hypothetical protein V493_04676 [Pseudogymnoascus sp. VKM F-4281 (FW-2241)]
MQLEDWLDDLCVRFIINLPEEDLSSVARICFQVEEAQWFYEDFIRPLDPSLPSMSLRSFCLRIFQHCPLLSAFSIDNHMRAFEEFLLYKTRVPVRGAIMLNQALDAVVLVKGWKKGANWSFPRGKINKDEDDLDCAVREVYEETGYDIRAAGLVPESDEVKYIDIPMREQHIRLYVFRDIPMDTHFEPRTRKEISKIEWYRLSDLPAFRKKNQQTGNDAEVAKNANKFYMVAPFLVPLKKWVQQQKKKDSERVSSNQYLSQYADEGQTEEEGFRSAIEGFEMPTSNPHPSSAPELNTMEGATAALHRLLKIQPATQGLQPHPGSAAQQPAGNTGDALLAILRGKPQGEAQQASFQPPRGPMDFAYNSAQTQRNPQHQYSMNPHESNPQPYSGASIGLDNRMQIEQQQNYNYATQHHQNSLSGGMRMANPQGTGAVGNPAHNAGQQHNATQVNASFPADSAYFPGTQFPGPQAQPQFGRHPQFLQHPQPLPPQVQQGVFTGGQSHGPILTPQFMQQATQQNMPQIPQQRPSQFSPPTQPNLPIMHESIISPPKPTPPQLTSHSLALLNAFRGQDRVVSESKASNSHPLSGFTQGHVTPTTQLQELPSENPLRDQAIANRPVASYEQRSPQAVAPSMTVESPPADVHKSALLSLFKTPTATTARMAKPVPAEPPQVPPMPAAVDTRPAVSPASAPRPRGPLPDGHLPLSKPKADGRSGVQSRAPEQQQPFRPTAILTRPAQAGSKPSTPQPTPQPRQPPQPSQAQQAQQPQQSRPAHGKGARKTGTAPKRQADVEAPQQAPKPFAPQILKRPPQGIPMPAELSGISPTRLSPPVLPDIDPQHAAQPTPPPGHKQALLSLFKKLPEPASSGPAGQQKLGPERPFASGGENTGAQQSRRTSNQTPMSPTDKGFLLGYLDTIAKGGL